MSLECELARVQMKRYLGGEELPADLMASLERHTKACTACQKHLDEQRLKLANELAGKKSPPAWKKLLDSIPKKPASSPDVFKPPHPLQGAINPKTLVLSTCLAVVLFAMSAIAKNPSMLFGPKAGVALADTKKASDSHGETGKDSHGDSKDEGHGDSGHEDSGHGDAKSDGHASEDSHKSEEGSGHSEKKSDEGHGDSHDSKPSEERASDEGHKSEESATHGDSHEAEPKKEPAPEREVAEPPAKPRADLLVAEEGSSPKLKAAPAPKPRPRADAPRRTKARSKIKSAPRRVRSTSKKAPAQPATRKNSIRVYDSQGKVIR